MQFFKVEGLITDEKWQEAYDNRRAARENAGRIAVKSGQFNQKLNKKAFWYVADMSENKARIGAIFCECVSPEKQLASFLNAIGLQLNDVFIEEITLSYTRSLLNCSRRNEYINDDDEVLEAFNLDRISGRSRLDYGESIIEEARKEEIYAAADHFLARDTVVSELDRIFAGKRRSRVTGHPVHYFVETDNKETRNTMYNTLFQALYDNGRLKSRRYCYMDVKKNQNISQVMYRLLIQALHYNGRLRSKRYCFLDVAPDEGLPESNYDCLYNSCVGGAVIVRYMANDAAEDNYASCGRETIETLAGIMKKYRSQVLTVFCLPRECAETKRIFCESLGNVSFIELKEDFVSGERAEAYLKTLAKENSVRTDKKLFAALEEGKGYLAPDLNEIFDKWYYNKLKTEVYPQYSDAVTAKAEVQKAAPKGNAYEELMEMIGIDGAKKVIVQALNYFKAQKLFADKGMKTENLAMHMVFTGNPGTAKTTVARLFARIMKDNGLLSKGQIIEVGRGDLVGKYVGWTAPKSSGSSAKREAASSLSTRRIRSSVPSATRLSTPSCRKWRTTEKTS